MGQLVCLSVCLLHNLAQTKGQSLPDIPNRGHPKMVIDIFKNFEKFITLTNGNRTEHASIIRAASNNNNNNNNNNNRTSLACRKPKLQGQVTKLQGFFSTPEG